MPGPHQVAQELSIRRFGGDECSVTAGVVIRMPVLPPRGKAEIARKQDST
jgi:hypothetical protein